MCEYAEFGEILNRNSLLIQLFVWGFSLQIHRFMKFDNFYNGLVLFSLLLIRKCLLHVVECCIAGVSLMRRGG